MIIKVQVQLSLHVHFNIPVKQEDSA